jgi:adenylate cyclase
VKRAGDGSLVEFRSVADAVRCAIEVQDGMVEPPGQQADASSTARTAVHRRLTAK